MNLEQRVHWQEVIMGKAQNKHFFRHSCCTKYFPTRMSFSAQGMNSGGVQMFNVQMLNWATDLLTGQGVEHRLHCRPSCLQQNGMG